MKMTECQLCKSNKLELVLDLGMHPLADTFVKDSIAARALPRYPLQVLLCTSCGHAMNSYIVPKEQRYQEHEYSYDSANSKAAVTHFDEMAREVSSKFNITAADLVVDIGGNVGTLLQAFHAHSGARMLNIEPAGNIATIAEKNGVPTIRDFWNADAADRVLAQGGAKVIIITNAFNHIDALDEFMSNICRSLAAEGVFVAEVPYFLTLVQREAFDTVYLEHVSYFSVRPLRSYFQKFGLSILDVTHNDYMGGSLRITVGRGAESSKVVEYVEREEKARLFDSDAYASFRDRVAEFKKSLLHDLRAAKTRGRIIGIGAATKGNTLLNYCGIDNTLLDFVTDASPLKVGKFTPGSGIPILADEAITDEITHALILPWNIADLLKTKLSPQYPKLAFIIPHMAP
ncbi:MAG: class I SAM-dependent methyltransferase [Patescibacteria group bacterium]